VIGDEDLEDVLERLSVPPSTELYGFMDDDDTLVDRSAFPDSPLNGDTVTQQITGHQTSS